MSERSLMSEPAPVPADREEALRSEARKAAHDWLLIYNLAGPSLSDGDYPKIETLSREFYCFGASARYAADRARATAAEAKVDQLASELREAREALARISYVWEQPTNDLHELCEKGLRAEAAEANLIALAKLYGEACSELQTLRWLLKGVADEADIADFLMTDEASDAS
jgi:hypothetical protein